MDDLAISLHVTELFGMVRASDMRALPADTKMIILRSAADAIQRRIETEAQRQMLRSAFDKMAQS